MGVAAIVVRDLQAREAVEKTETKNIATDKCRPSAKGGFGGARCLAFRRELRGGGCRVALDLFGGIGGIVIESCSSGEERRATRPSTITRSWT